MIEYEEIPSWAKGFFQGEGFPDYVAKEMKEEIHKRKYILGWIKLHCMEDTCKHEWDTETVWGLFDIITDKEAKETIHRCSGYSHMSKQCSCPKCGNIGGGPLKVWFDE